MDNQVNTGGGAAIPGNVIAQRDFVGRDQINNIVIVGSFLQLAQIEDLLPKIQQSDNFASLTEALKSALGDGLSNDLVEGFAFAGGIIEDFLSTQIRIHRSQPIILRDFLLTLINHIGTGLNKTDYWNACSQSVYGYADVVMLEATLTLWNKQFPDNKKNEIFIGRNI